jgi:hypothetical protein
MDEYARRLDRVREALAPMPSAVEPEDEDEASVGLLAAPRRGSPITPRPRETSLRKEVVRQPSDSVLSRQLDAAHAAIGLVRDELQAHKASTRECLNALADEAGAQSGTQAKQIGELKTQIAELQTQLSEARRDIGLLHSLQPQKLLRKTGAPVQIEGSLTGHVHAADALN